MNVDQISIFLKDMIKQYENEFRFLNKASQKEQYDPKAALKTALICVNGEIDVLLTDIMEIIVLFLMRGPKISKAIKNTKESSKKRINSLKLKYKLKDFASTEEVINGTALSINKLIPAFPYQLLIIMKEKKFNRPLGNDILDEAKATNFPDFLKITTFLSIIPFPREILRKNTWHEGKEGLKNFITIVHGVIAYAYLESFVLHKWSNSVSITSAKALWNVISVAQNTLNSNFINQEKREDLFENMCKDDLYANIGTIENLIHYTEQKFPGFQEVLNCHFNYNVKTMKFECNAKLFCRHVEH